MFFKIGVLRNLPDQEAITIHILTNISRSKGSQAMKFIHLIEHNMRNFLKNLTQNANQILFLVSFLKKIKLKISLDQYSKVSYHLFLCYAKLRTIKIYLK